MNSSRRVLLTHRLIRQERDASPASDISPGVTPGEPQHAAQSPASSAEDSTLWHRRRPVYHPVDTLEPEAHITLWDEIEDFYNKII